MDSPALRPSSEDTPAMPSIQSLGIGSGLLTSELLDDIIGAERKATDLRIDTRKTELEAKISAFGAVRSKVDALRTAAAALGSASSVLPSIATSTNESVVTATANSAASAGVHTIEVSALARAHTVASIRFDDIASVIGTGTLNFRFGTTTFDGSGDYDSFTVNGAEPGGSVVIDNTNNTVTGIRDAINKANIGVKASIVNDGDGYRLVLTSAKSGAANSMEITAIEGGSPGLSALAFNADESEPGTNMSQTVAAENAVAAIDGITITRDTNKISGVIEGVTFDLLSTNVDAPAMISVGRDEQGIATRLQAFVDAFNDVKALTGELTAFDPDAKQGSLLTGDAALRGLASQLRRMMGSAVAGLGSDAIRSLVDLGVTTDQNNGYFLTFSQSRLTEALARDATAVAGLLATSKTASDSLIEFVGFGNKTEPGSYVVQITRAPARGQLLAASLAPNDFNDVKIDDDNDELSVAVNGVASGTITLTQGKYADGAAMAAEIETRINADPALLAAGALVTVAFNATDNRYEITSRQYGPDSIVAMLSVDTKTASELGFDVDDGESGRGADVEGLVNGRVATGKGQFLTVPSGPQPATAGYVNGATVTGFQSPPLSLDANNSTFSLAVNGVNSGTISLTQGNYADGAALAAEMEAKVNADAALSAAGAAVRVTYDTTRSRFVMTSTKVGAGSGITLIDVPEATTTALGLAAGGGIAGRDATTVGDAAGGIQIKVLGGPTGDRGTVALVRGVMNRIDRYLGDMLSFTGTIRGKTDSLTAQVDKLEQERAAFDDRMTALEARLRTQFAAADAIISQLNSTSQYLDQQLSALPLLNRNK
jgi:flagellar hook-associated protein 2